MRIDVDVLAILSEVRNRGISVIENFLNPDEVEAVQREVTRVVESKPRWATFHKTDSGYFFHLRPEFLRRVGLLAAIENMARAVVAPPIRDCCDRYLGSEWYIERVIAHSQQATGQPLTE